MTIHERRRPSGPPASSVRGRSGGVGRAASAAAARVSDDLRRHEGGFLDERRRVAALSLAATAAMGVVAAYQNGLIRRPPEPRLGFLDAEGVDASAEAYQLFKAPDAALAVASYGVTLALAGMGSATRSADKPWVPVALAAKVLIDAAGGAYLTAEQATKHRRFCSWCLAAAVASLAMVPQVLPEARAAFRQLAG